MTYRSLISQWSDLWHVATFSGEDYNIRTAWSLYRPVPIRKLITRWWHTYWQIWKNDILIPRCIDHGSNCIRLAGLGWELGDFLLQPQSLNPPNVLGFRCHFVAISAYLVGWPCHQQEEVRMDRAWVLSEYLLHSFWMDTWSQVPNLQMIHDDDLQFLDMRYRLLMMICDDHYLQ